MRQMLDIPLELLTPSTRDSRTEGGAFCYIAHSEPLADLLQQHYGRDGLCLKIFKADAEPLSEFCWSAKSGVLLTDCTKAQNLFACQGYAPRVYDIVLVNDKHWAQVTTYVEDDGGTFDRLACKADVVDHYGIRAKGGDMNDKNWIGSQMVDFQYHYLPRETYEPALRARATAHGQWGSRPDPYQGIIGLGIGDAQRDTTSRILAMHWHELDFTGKTVLDVGCNLGAFCLEADARGARRVVGVDRPHVAETAYEAANWMGHWNVDYLGLNLPPQADRIASTCGISTFDIILALSVKQVEPLPWIADLCGGVCFFEGHVPDREVTWRTRLEECFEVVEFLGMTKDHGPRPLFRCEKRRRDEHEPTEESEF